MCVQQRLKSACASAQSDQSLRCPHEETLHHWLVWICRFSLPLGIWEGLRFVIVALPGFFSFFYSKCTLWRFLSDCANAQADLNLPWVHVFEGTFSDLAPHIIRTLRRCPNAVFRCCAFAYFLLCLIVLTSSAITVFTESKNTCIITSSAITIFYSFEV